MISEKKIVIALASSLSLATLAMAPVSRASSSETQEPASSASTAKPVGTIKALAGNAITLTTDSGSELNVLVQGSTRMLRITPGEKDLKNAAPMSLPELQVGDRILVRGKMSDDGKNVVAASIIAVKKTDIAVRQQHELQDWQKRGTGGLVKSIDPANKTITISTSAIVGSKNLAVHVSPGTIIRRYAQDSVKFDDAKPGTIEEIKPGDQLRARGNRSADGTELAADEIVSGSFRNIAGTIASIDSSKNTITVSDLATKKSVVVRITPDSQVRKLPPMIAQRLAMRLKGAATDANASARSAETASSGPAADNARARDSRTTGWQRPGGSGSDAGAARPGGSGDIQQMLNRMPAVPFTDLQKGDAVMIVTTEGSANSDVTAITLLTGVEPILTASPNGSGAASILSPWSLGSSPADAAAGP